MTRKRIISELVLLCSFAFLPAILFSVYLLFNSGQSSLNNHSQPNFVYDIIYSLLSISLLFNVLFKRNKSYKDLGIVISWRQVFAGVLVACMAYTIFYLARYLLTIFLPPSYTYLIQEKNIEFLKQGFSVPFLLFVIINPFREELIVRGFLMTEVFYLTNSKWFAVIASVLFQTSYHLYQGLVPAALVSLIFLFFSLFYIKTGKLTPVIVAHLVMDLLILAFQSDILKPC